MQLEQEFKLLSVLYEGRIIHKTARKLSLYCTHLLDKTLSQNTVTVFFFNLIKISNRNTCINITWRNVIIGLPLN